MIRHQRMVSEGDCPYKKPFEMPTLTFQYKFVTKKDSILLSAIVAMMSVWCNEHSPNEVECPHNGARTKPFYPECIG